MKNLVSLFTLIAILFALTSCQERPEVPPIEEPTVGSLLFTFNCNNGALEGAEVGLTFNHPDDEEIVYLEVLTTDANGQATFKDLEPGLYYFLIKYPGQDTFVDNKMGGIEVNAGPQAGYTSFLGRDCN